MGIENHVVSTLEKVRGCDTNADADPDDENDDDDECKNDSSTTKKTKKKKKKKKDDFYDPSILASPSLTPADNETSIADDIERDKLLFQEVIDLARGGIGGQYTNTLPKKKKKKKHKTKQKKKKRRKKKRVRRTSLDNLPLSPCKSIKSIKSDIHYPNKKRRLDKDKLSKERHETMLTTKLVKPKSKMRSSLYHLSIDDSKLTILTQPDEHINTKKESIKKKKEDKGTKNEKMECETSTKTKTDKPPPL